MICKCSYFYYCHELYQTLQKKKKRLYDHMPLTWRELRLMRPASHPGTGTPLLTVVHGVVVGMAKFPGLRMQNVEFPHGAIG